MCYAAGQAPDSCLHAKTRVDDTIVDFDTIWGWVWASDAYQPDDAQKVQASY